MGNNNYVIFVDYPNNLSASTKLNHYDSILIDASIPLMDYILAYIQIQPLTVKYDTYRYYSEEIIDDFFTYIANLDLVETNNKLELLDRGMGRQLRVHNAIKSGDQLLDQLLGDMTRWVMSTIHVINYNLMDRRIFLVDYMFYIYPGNDHIKVNLLERGA